MLWKCGSWEQTPQRFVLFYFILDVIFYFILYVLFYFVFDVLLYFIFDGVFILFSQWIFILIYMFVSFPWHSNILTSVKRCWSWVLFFTLSTADYIEWDFPLLSGMSQLQYVRWKIACCFICWILFGMNMGRIVVANVNSMSKSTFSTNNSLPWKIHKIYLINPCAFFNIVYLIEILFKIFKWNWIVSVISFIFVSSFPMK